MEFKEFSPKQLLALTWWTPGSKEAHRSGLICDGAVRSGKTLCMSVSFAAWALWRFSGQSFALCGKTIASLRRNVVTPLLGVLRQLGFECREKVSKNYFELTMGERTGRFYLFGGKDEGSGALIQGITLGGVLFDEVALMPRSFVEQALARCSVAGSTFWFNCNPEHPFHWFYNEWIKKRRERNMLYLHFALSDNPALGEEIVRRYHSLYTGAFFERFVLGKWVAAEGAVYPMFERERHVVDTVPDCERWYLSCDYGTLNPTSIGLWGERDGVWYRAAEYYHDARESGIVRTDEEYYEALCALAGEREIEAVVVDPSAASFITCIRRHGRFLVIPACNDVLDGIRVVSDMLRSGQLRFHQSCGGILREFGLYRWDQNSAQDAPIKRNDHAMDEMRYLCMTVARSPQSGFYALSPARQEGDCDWT